MRIAIATAFLCIVATTGYCQKTYTITQLEKDYKKIPTNEVIAVKFSRVTSIQGDSPTTYQVNLMDEDQERVLAYVNEAGVKWFERIQKLNKTLSIDQQAPVKIVYCTVEEQELINRNGGQYLAPVIHCLGRSVSQAMGGSPQVSW